MEPKELKDMEVPELQEIAKGLGIEKYEELKKGELVAAIKKAQKAASPSSSKSSVELVYPIKHEGKWHQPGKKLKVDAGFAKELIDRGLAK